MTAPTAIDARPVVNHNDVLRQPDLDRLGSAWRAQGAPAPGSLPAGLSQAELDAYAAELGFDLPGDLRVWWGWHNGAVDGVSSLGALPLFGGGRTVGRTHLGSAGPAAVHLTGGYFTAPAVRPAWICRWKIAYTMIMGMIERVSAANNVDHSA